MLKISGEINEIVKTEKIVVKSEWFLVQNVGSPSAVCFTVLL